MQSNNFSRGRSSHSSSGRSGGGYGGGRSFGNRSFGSGRFQKFRGFKGQSIRHEKYIAKAVEVLESPYEPSHKFSDFDLVDILKQNIAKKNYINPTKIQDQSIPRILEGKDVMSLATTGSGKTAAFLVPLINKAIKDPRQKVLIIIPTRELAAQIQTEFVDLTHGARLRSVLVIGGASAGNQIAGLRRNPQFVIGTPGRLQDLYERRALNLSEFNNIVLDEVDRMLDMGFIDDIKFLISKLKPQKQSLFFSATMDKQSEVIANTLLNNPVKIEISRSVTARNVEQDIIKVDPSKTKIQVLQELLEKEECAKVLIFSKTKRGSDKLSMELFQRGFKVEAIHGGKTQSKRDMVISKFRMSRIDILVATDVAARGLDIPDISHVINYDEPATYEDYIHRIGRTGRVGKRGKAYTFV